MKTQNFALELMQSNLVNKDILFNENLLKIDAMMANCITAMVNDAPSQINANEKFIIMGGNNKNFICFKAHPEKPIELIKPVNGMIFYVISEQDFFLFNNDNWSKIKSASAAPVNMAIVPGPSVQTTTGGAPSLLTGQEKFIGIQGDYSAPVDQEFLHLYINDNVIINLDAIKTKQTTFIIKQHYQQVRTLEWPSNILWQNKTPHKMTPKANVMDVVKVYRLIETNHFLGEIIGQGYEF